VRESVRECLEWMFLHEFLTTLVTHSLIHSPYYTVLHYYRYLFAYLNHRTERVRALRWETGAVLPPHVLPKLSPREHDYFMEYTTLLNDYCSDIMVDLASDLEVSASLHYCTTALLHYYTIAQLHHYTTTPPHYYTITLLHHSTSTPLHY
jgi:hypothetical protein